MNECIAVAIVQINNEIEFVKSRIESCNIIDRYSGTQTKYKGTLVGLEIAKQVCNELLHKDSMCKAEKLITEMQLEVINNEY